MYECAECGAEVIVDDRGTSRTCVHDAAIVGVMAARAAGTSKVM